MLGFETAGREGVPLSAVLTLLTVGTIALILYIRHASRHPHPILDLLLFRIPSFAIAVGAGTLFRTGVGAIPFLLPLMLQVGFGMSAFASGLLTFMSAVGALAMKITARPILRRFGFRTCLVGNALISAAFLMTYAGFRPETPRGIILMLLLIGGFSRSLQFTGINTLAFADVPPNRMSRATSLSSTAQQLSQSMGVATGAVLLHLTLFWRGTETLSSLDFWPSFIVVATLAGVSAWFFRRLPRDAGAEVSGHLYVKPPR